MSNKPEDNEIDKLFKNSIDNLETEPSDRFWNQAYDGILKRENEDFVTKIARWRGASIILAVVASSLIGYNVYTNHKVTEVENRMATLENKQLQLASNENKLANSMNSSSINSNEQNSKAVAAIEPKAVTNNVRTVPSTVYNRPVVTSASPAISRKVFALNNNHSIASTGQVASANTNSSKNNVAQSSPVTNNNINATTVTNDVVNSNTNSTTNTVANSTAIIGSTNTVADNSATSENVVAENNIRSTTGNISFLENKTYTQVSEPEQKENKLFVASKILDTATILRLEDRVPIGPRKKLLRNCFFTAFFSPSDAMPVVKTDGDYRASDIKSEDKQNFTYSFGINMGYDISTKLSVSLGLNYSRYGYTVNSTTVYPQFNDNNNYSLATEAGVVNMPFITPTNLPVNQMTYALVPANVSGKGELAYICFPVKFKYDLLKYYMWKFYAMGGGSVNLFASDYTFINYSNTFGAGTQQTDYIPGTNRVNVSMFGGLGIERAIKDGYRIFAEASYQAALTPTISGTVSPVTTYLNYADITVGFRYHF